MAIEVILFDLGGVLIELPALPTIMRSSRLAEETILRQWHTSEGVRGFESGRTSASVFAHAVVTEFELDTSPEAFLETFTGWPTGLYPGTQQLLAQLGNHYHLACLSNTNHLHWARFHEETPLFDLLHTSLASHLVGIMKPHHAIYAHAIAALGKPAGNILFLDDNEANVDAARQSGMQAALTRGLDGVMANLAAHGVATG